MASFDIVSEVDGQKLDNAINSAKKEILSRYDFKGSESSIELDKKINKIHVVTEDNMKLDAIENIIFQKLQKQGLDSNCLDLGKEEYAAGNKLKKDIDVRSGIEKETAKKIVKSIKELKIKVDPSIMDEKIRVSGKKIDDLQQVIAHIRKEDFGIPLQFVNMK